METRVTASPPVILVCSVGGSRDPIRSAIEALHPARACFVVSDGANGPSSITEVEGPDGHKAHAERLGCEATEVLKVPADDPDGALARVGGRLRQLQADHPGHRIVADYTGGTKSMSGALLMAALARSGIEVQVMAGRRPDLRHVEPGTEKRHPVPSDFVVADRQLSLAASLARGCDYSAALVVLDGLQRQLARGNQAFRPPRDWTCRLAAALRACQVLAHWDAFRHARAWQLLSQARDDGMPYMDAFTEAHASALERLASQPRDEPSWRLCSDLQRNAERLAARGRFDDALARLYRLAEAAAQARLFARWHLRSGAIPPAELPDRLRSADLERRDRRTGQVFLELPLMRTLELLEARDPQDPLVAAWDRREDGRLASPAWQAGRNRSILAHGFQPVDEATWTAAKRWIDDRLAPFWQGEAMPPLPTTLPI